MPVYEYICSCGNEQEELVPMGTSTIECKECGKGMTKIISRSSFHLKGSGWASTGYSKETKKKNKQ